VERFGHDLHGALAFAIGIGNNAGLQGHRDIAYSLFVRLRQNGTGLPPQRVIA
jgi:hypothetical protein